MKKEVKRILSIAVLLMLGMGAMADDLVKVEFAEGFTFNEGTQVYSVTGGVVSVKEQKANTEDETLISTEVTITVTPDEGYFITKGDVKVYLTIPASTRTVDFDNLLTLSGDEPKDKTASREYTFTVPAGFGAIIYEANFQSADALYNIGGGADPAAVRWSLNDEKTTITITGTGATKDFDLEADMDPFEAFRADGSIVTTIVVGEGITGLGANIFKNFVGLSKIIIQNKNALLTLGENAINTEGVTIEVPGNLYNEYMINDAWSPLRLSLAYPEVGTVSLTGIAFDANNSYRAFAYAGGNLMIPSVLKAYVISGLNEEGTSLVLAEVTDKVIPAGVPVLLMASSTVTEGFFTSTTGTAGTATGKYLKVAPAEDGLDVGAGQVYLLYNDRFYFSQAGHLSGGRVYLDMRAEPAASTRGSLGLGNDGATAIDATLENGEKTTNDGWYTLDGRRLSTAPHGKGIYIMDGKKVVVK